MNEQEAKHINVIKQVGADEFYSEVVDLKMKGWRLVQICCANQTVGGGDASETGNQEMSYSFAGSCARGENNKTDATPAVAADGDMLDMITLRVVLEPGQHITSITQSYPCAFLQENEAAELFGVKIDNITLDYDHKLYRIEDTTPFAPGSIDVVGDKPAGKGQAGKGQAGKVQADGKKLTSVAAGNHPAAAAQPATDTKSATGTKPATGTNHVAGVQPAAGTKPATNTKEAK